MKSKLSFKQMVMNRLPATVLMYLIKSNALNNYVANVKTCIDNYFEMPYFTPKTYEYGLDHMFRNVKTAGGYINVFAWAESPQGFQYWKNIMLNIIKLRNTPFYNV